MAGAGAQEGHDAPEVVGAAVHVERTDRFLAVGDLRQALGQAREWRDEVRDAGGDRVLRHGREVGLGRLLHHDDAAGFLDGTDPRRAVRTGARQDHGDAVAAGSGDGAEEHVDRCPVPARLGEGPGRDAVAFDHQLAVGRDDVDAIGRQGRPVVDPQDRHSGANGKDLAEHTRLVGREMENDDVGEPEIGREVTKQPLQGRDAAGRGADGTDRHKLLAHAVREFVIAHRRPFSVKPTATVET